MEGEKSYATEVVTLMEGELTCYRNLQYNGGRMVLTEVASLKEGEWSCYSLMESMVMLLRWIVNGERMVMLQL